MWNPRDQSYSWARVAKLLLINTLVCVNFKSKAKQAKDTVVDLYVRHILTLRSHETNLMGTVVSTNEYSPLFAFQLFSTLLGELGLSKKVWASIYAY